jgi:hypothetical protein
MWLALSRIWKIIYIAQLSSLRLAQNDINIEGIP